MACPAWLSSIEQQLTARDMREKIPFEHISDSYNLLLAENADLSKRVHDLNQAVLQMKTDNWNKTSNSVSDVTDKDTAGDNDKKSGSAQQHYQMASLQSENEALRQELMDVYRLKKENEEALLRLKKQSIENEELILQQTRSINEVSIKHHALTNEHQELKEDDERLKSNLYLLNNESVELRKAHDNAMKELDQYKDENRRLTEQLLKVKESQMEHFDQLNDEYEKLRKINEAKVAQHTKEAEQKLNDALDIPANVMQRRHTMSGAYHSPTHTHQSQHTSGKEQKTERARHRWSIADIFGGGGGNGDKDGKKQSPPHAQSPPISAMDFSVRGAPTVDLYGPSLFNINPPQLKSRNWQAHKGIVCALNFDVTGKKLISGGNDQMVKMWDAGSGQELATLRGCTSGILCAHFSPNSAFIGAGGNDCQLHLWNVKTQRQIRVYNGHSNKITSIAFSGDSRIIYSGSHDRTLKFWDLETAACRHTMSAHSSVNDLCISPDDYYIATAHLDGCIRFWGKRDRKELFKLSEHQPIQTIGIEFSPPDGIQILTASKNGKICIWDLRKQEKLHEIFDKQYKNTNLSGKPRYSPDGQYILGGSSVESNTLDGKYPLFIWTTKTAKLEYTLTEHSAEISRVVWHGRGGVVSSDRNGMIATWC